MVRDCIEADAAAENAVHLADLLGGALSGRAFSGRGAACLGEEEAFAVGRPADQLG